MQIVIEIPEPMFDWFDNGFPNEEDAKKLWHLVKNGTPLPKGHGKLKDIDQIIKDGRSKGFCDWYDEMEIADTIIEADKESEG